MLICLGPRPLVTVGRGLYIWCTRVVNRAVRSLEWKPFSLTAALFLVVLWILKYFLETVFVM